MDSVHPSETVHFDDHDDDVSTLSGSSSAPHSPNWSPKRPAASPQKKSKTRLHPYLNGHLPVHVSAALQIKRTNCREENKKGIPIDIKISIENASIASSKHSDDDQVATRDLDMKHEEVEQLEADNERLDVRKGNNADALGYEKSSLLEKKAFALDYSPITSIERNHTRIRSPIGKTPRRQRLLRLRKVGERANNSQTMSKYKREVETIICANIVHEVGTKRVDSADLNLEAPAVPSQEFMPREVQMNADRMPQLVLENRLNESLESKVSREKLGDKTSDVSSTHDELIVSSVMGGKSTPKTSRHNHRKTLMHTTFDINSTNTPDAASLSRQSPSKESSSWKIIETGTSRIHRSFWSVPVQKNYHSSPLSVYTPSTSTSSTTYSPARSVSMMNHGQARLSQLVKEYDSPSRVSLVSRPSGIFEDSKPVEGEPGPCTISEPGPCTLRKANAHGNDVDSSPSRTSVMSSTSKSSQASRNSHTTSFSLKSFDELYDGVMRQLKCDVTTCTGKSKDVLFTNVFACTERFQETSVIDEPPSLRRLVLGGESVNDAASGSKCESDGDETFATTCESSFNDTPSKDGGFEILLKEMGGEQKSFTGKHSVHTALKEEELDSERSYDLQYHDNIDNSDAELSAISEYQAAFKKLWQDDSCHETIVDTSESETSGSTSLRNQKVAPKRILELDSIIAKLQDDLPQTGYIENRANTNNSNPRNDTIITSCCTSSTGSQERHERNKSGSTIDTNTIITTEDLQAPIQTSNRTLKLNRILRKNILSTPTRAIVKKLRKASNRVRKISSHKKTMQPDLGDEKHLLSISDTDFHHDSIVALQDIWWNSSCFSKYNSPSQPTKQKLYSHL